MLASTDYESTTNNNNTATTRSRRRRPRHEISSSSSQEVPHFTANSSLDDRIPTTVPWSVQKPLPTPMAQQQHPQKRLSLPFPYSHHFKSKCKHRTNHSNNIILWKLALVVAAIPVVYYYLKINNKHAIFFDNLLFTTPNRSLRIPYLMHQSDTDYMQNEGEEGNRGGWLVTTQRRVLPEMMPEPNSGLADYGGLVILSLQQQRRRKRLTTSTIQRKIRLHDDELCSAEKQRLLDSVTDHISKRHWFDDELEDIEQDCRRPSWEMLHFPSCNAFHEIDLSRHYDKVLATRSGDVQAGDSSYLSHGYFRDVFALNRDQDHAKAVLKVARYTKHEMNYRPLFNARRDAIIMERLTSSDKIVDIFGLCGSSVMVESLPNELENKIVPGGGWMKHEDLKDSDDVDIQNNFTVPEKLYLALEMAESIAVLHGFKDGVIVHDDIQLCQWLRNDSGKLKLGDFNRARVLGWNEKKQEYCSYDNGRGYGNVSLLFMCVVCLFSIILCWLCESANLIPLVVLRIYSSPVTTTLYRSHAHQYRSPEEYDEKDLLNSHDVWSFGNNLYALLTGLWVFYEDEDDTVVSEKIVKGDTAFIDDRYRTRSYIEGRMVELMEKCWIYDMNKRISIFEAVEFLRETVEEHERRGGKKK